MKNKKILLLFCLLFLMSSIVSSDENYDKDYELLLKNAKQHTENTGVNKKLYIDSITKGISLKGRLLEDGVYVDEILIKDFNIVLKYPETEEQYLFMKNTIKKIINEIPNNLDENGKINYLVDKISQYKYYQTVDLPYLNKEGYSNYTGYTLLVDSTAYDIAFCQLLSIALNELNISNQIIRAYSEDLDSIVYLVKVKRNKSYMLIDPLKRNLKEKNLYFKKIEHTK